SRINARMVTDLPEPDSPMMQRTSPAMSEKETPLTARTVSSRLAEVPCRLSTSTSGREESLRTVLDWCDWIGIKLSQSSMADDRRNMRVRHRGEYFAGPAMA